MLENNGNYRYHLLIIIHFAFCARCSGLSLWCEQFFRTQEIGPLKPSGYYMYHQFNIQQFYVLPTQCIYVFCVELRTNSDYFPIQH